MMNDIIDKIRSLLVESIDIRTKETSQKFFKEKIEFYGVKIPVVNKISKNSIKDIEAFDKAEIFRLIEILWQSGILEESFIACNWTYSLRKIFQPNDFEIFKNWIDLYINNWASCDTFCNHSVGEFIQMYPDFLTELKKFTKSKNIWIRRASALKCHARLYAMPLKKCRKILKFKQWKSNVGNAKPDFELLGFKFDMNTKNPGFKNNLNNKIKGIR